MGVKFLSKIQLGRETTEGDAVAATTLWRGVGYIEDALEVVFPEENIGLLTPSDRSYIPKKAAKISFADTEMTFEQLLHLCEAGLKSVTPTTDSGSGYIFDYPFPVTSPVLLTDTDPPMSYTIEGGDNVEAEEMEYSLVEEFTLSGKAGEAWKMSATWFGRQCSTSTFTGSLTVPVVEECLFGKTKLYIDSSSDDYGTTQKTATLMEASLKIKTGWKPQFTADGNLYFTFAKNTGPEIELSLTYEHDSISVAEKVAWRAKTPRNIQLLIEGTALTSAGAYTYKTVKINVSGKYTKFDPLSDQDGNTVIKATLKGAYNITNAKLGGIVIVNDLSAVP